jgi:hypothetical protein
MREFREEKLFKMRTLRSQNRISPIGSEPFRTESGWEEVLDDFKGFIENAVKKLKKGRSQQSLGVVSVGAST